MPPPPTSSGSAPAPWAKQNYGPPPGANPYGPPADYYQGYGGYSGYGGYGGYQGYDQPPPPPPPGSAPWVSINTHLYAE